MLISLALACALVPTRADSAADYFPVGAGTKWTYTEETRYGSGKYTDEAKAPIEFGADRAYPVERRQEGKVVDTVYYRIGGDTVSIVAYDPKYPLEVPRIVLKVGAGPQRWEYSGVGTASHIKVKAVSTTKGKRSILGREAECLEVKVESILEVPDQRPLVSRQTSIYAKGVGLVEMQDKMTVDRKTEERKVKLVEFAPAQP